MEKVLFWSRVVGALAIGVSGVLSAFGLNELAQFTMILGTAAAAPARGDQ